jgi:hypothetical protein
MKRTIRLEFEYEFDNEDWRDWYDGIEDWSENEVLTLMIEEIGWGDIISDGENLAWSFADDTPKATA